jgi:hypothetical protein
LPKRQRNSCKGVWAAANYSLENVNKKEYFPLHPLAISYNTIRVAMAGDAFGVARWLCLKCF